MGKHSSIGPIDPQFGPISTGDVIEEMAKAKKEMAESPGTIPFWNALIAKYPPAFIGTCEKAVRFSVENVDVKKGGFLKPSFFKVTGHVLYGTFTPLDEVSIGMNSEQKVKIRCLDNPHSPVPVSDTTIQRGTNKLLIDWSWAEGGEEAAFIFQEKSLNLKPGDLIVKD